jgi:hypothetical protein
MKKYAGIILILFLAFSLYRCTTDSEEVGKRRSGPPPARFIFLEQESIVAFFEATHIDEYKKLLPSIFSMPEKPLCMVIINNFHKMESAPP